MTLDHKRRGRRAGGLAPSRDLFGFGAVDNPSSRGGRRVFHITEPVRRKHSGFRAGNGPWCRRSVAVVTTAAEIDALLASGATVEMIAAMFKAHVTEKEKAQARRRAGATVRKANERKRKRAAKHGGPERDLGDEMQGASGEQQYIDAAIVDEESRMSRVTPVTERDKRNPHKENTSSLCSEVNSDASKEDASATAGVAPPTAEIIDLRSGSIFAPVVAIEDARTRLWREGTSALVSLGLKESRARSVIGGWMRDTGDDALGVLTAIQFARDRLPVGDVVAYVTKSLGGSRNAKGATNGHHGSYRNGGPGGLARLAAGLGQWPASQGNRSDDS